MSVIKVETTVTGVEVARIEYEGKRISLGSDDQGTHTSLDMVNVGDGILNMLFDAQDVPGTAWTLEVKQLKPVEKGLFKKSGMITNSGHSLVVDAVLI